MLQREGGKGSRSDTRAKQVLATQFDHVLEDLASSAASPCTLGIGLLGMYACFGHCQLVGLLGCGCILDANSVATRQNGHYICGSMWQQEKAPSAQPYRSREIRLANGARRSIYKKQDCSKAAAAPSFSLCPLVGSRDL